MKSFKSKHYAGELLATLVYRFYLAPAAIGFGKHTVSTIKRY
jgi:hypothetical protein